MKPHTFMATAMLCAIFIYAMPAKADPAEETLLQGLNPQGQAFFKRSMALRSEYPEDHPYKHFNRDRDNDGKTDVMDADGYLRLVPKNNAYVPNPAVYGDLGVPQEKPAVLYRLVKDCSTKITIERQVIDASYGYGNIRLTDRYQQQCIDDGTMDNYYVESGSPPEGD